MVRTHLRKSATPLRSPQCMGTPTKYRSQLATNTEPDTSSATTGSPTATEATTTAAWKSSTRRAQLTAFRPSSGCPS